MAMYGFGRRRSFNCPLNVRCKNKAPQVRAADTPPEIRTRYLRNTKLSSRQRDWQHAVGEILLSWMTDRIDGLGSCLRFRIHVVSRADEVSHFGEGGLWRKSRGLLVLWRRFTNALSGELPPPVYLTRSQNCERCLFALYVSVHPSVRLSACMNSASTVRIFIKFFICVFFENPSRKFKFWWKFDNNNGYFVWRPRQICDKTVTSSS